MAIGSSNFTSISYVEETSYGECPTAQFQEIPMTGESIQYSKSSITSNNISSSRQVSDNVQTSFEVSGGLNIEMAPKVYDDFIEGVMWNDWGTTTSESSLTITADQAGGTFTTSSGTPFADLAVGQFFRINGTDSNDGIYQIKTVTDTVITVTDGFTLTDETDTSGVTVTGSMIRNPADGAETVTHSYFIEKCHNDLDPRQYFSFDGMMVDSFSVNAQSAQILTGSFNFMGQDAAIYNDNAYDETDNPNGNGDGDAASGSKSDSAVANPITFNGLNAVSHVGDIRINDTNVNATGDTSGNIYFQGLDFTVSNNLRGVQAIGKMGNVDVSPGQLSVTGSLNALFADDTMYRRFLSGEEFSLSYAVLDENNEGYVFYFPRVTITQSDMSAGGNDQDLVENMQWSALMDSDTSTSIQIDRLYNSYS